MDENENNNEAEQPTSLGSIIGAHPHREWWSITVADTDGSDTTTSARPAGAESRPLVLRTPTVEEETARMADAFTLGMHNLRLVEDPYVRDLLAESYALTFLPSGIGQPLDRPTVIPAHAPGTGVRPEPMRDEMWPEQHGFDVCWRCQDLDRPTVAKALRVAWLWSGRGSVVELAVCDDCAAALSKYEPHWMA